jgi:hypothetical protein
MQHICGVGLQVKGGLQGLSADAHASAVPISALDTAQHHHHPADSIGCFGWREPVEGRGQRGEFIGDMLDLPLFRSPPTQEEQGRRRQAERDFLELMSSIEGSGASGTHAGQQQQQGGQVATQRLSELQVGNPTLKRGRV